MESSVGEAGYHISLVAAAARVEKMLTTIGTTTKFPPSEFSALKFRVENIVSTLKILREEGIILGGVMSFGGASPLRSARLGDFIPILSHTARMFTKLESFLSEFVSAESNQVETLPLRELRLPLLHSELEDIDKRLKYLVKCLTVDSAE